VRVALADATVRVILDVTRFDRDLQTKVASAARRAGRQFESEFTKTTRAAAKKWATEFQDETDKAMSGAGTKAGSTFGDRVRRAARPTGRLTGRDLGEQIRGGLLQTTNDTGRQYSRGLLGSLTEGGNRLGQRFASAISSGVQTRGVGTRLRRQIEDDSEPGVLAAARTVASRFGNALSSAMGAVSISRFGLLVTAVGGLVAEGAQLAAAVEPALQGIGLIPAAAAVAAASVTTLVVAFKGMGNALSAAASGDPKKLAEALKNLSPAARSVVKEFGALVPQLHELRLQVQQAFFSQLTGDLTKLGDALIGPVQRGMTATASAAGRMASGLANTLSQTGNAGAIEEIFNSAARAFDQMTVPLQRLTTGMLSFIRATLPAFDQLVATLGSGTARFGDFLARAAASGQAFAWVTEAITTLSQIGRIALSAGRVISTIFDAANAAGGTYLTSLNDALVATRNFLAVGEGRTALVNIFEGIHQVVQSLALPLQAAVVAFGQISQVAGSVSQALSAGLAAAIRGIGQAITNAGPGLTAFAAALGAEFADLGSVLPSVGRSLGNLLSAAAPLVSVFGVVAHAAAALLSVISSIPGPILTVVAAFAGLRALGLPTLFGKISEKVGGLGGSFGAVGSAASSVGSTFGRVADTYRTNLASLTALRIEQQVTANAMSSGIPQVGGFGAALGGLGDRAKAAGGAIGGSLLRGASSLLGMLGGPLGIALTGASVLISLWAEKQQKADQAVAAHDQRVRQLAGTLDKVTGSITNATREQARQTFASSDLADAATHLGLSIDSVADAATGSEAAQKRLLTQLHDSARGAVEASDNYSEFRDLANELGVSMDTLVSAAMGNADAFNQVKEAGDRTGTNWVMQLGQIRALIPDQTRLSGEVKATAASLQAQAEAIRRANAEISPATRLASNLADAMGTLADNSSSAADKARALDTALRLLNGGTVDLADAQKANADAVVSGNQQMQELIDKYNVAGKSASQLGISTKEMADRQAELGQALFDSGGQINFASERARGLYEVTKDLRTATLDQAAAIVDNAQKTGGNMSEAYQRAADLIGQTRQQVIQWATDAGFGAEAGSRLADMMNLIPDNVKVALSMENVPAILEQLGHIKGDIELLPDKKSVRLDSNARGMRKELENFGFTVENIPGSKDIKITPNTSEAAAALQTFITQQITSKDPDLMVGANTSAAQLSVDQIQSLVTDTRTEMSPSINTGPVIADWQNLLLGPLNPGIGTPVVTPSVNGAPVTSWFGSYLQNLAPPGDPTVQPGFDPTQIQQGWGLVGQLAPPPGKPVITPGVDGSKAKGQMPGMLNDLIPPPGEPTITPGVDTGPAHENLEGLGLPNGRPQITPSVYTGPAEQKLDGLARPIDGSPQITPAANIRPAQTTLSGLIALIDTTQTTGPTVNGNTGPATAALALLLQLINTALGMVNVGANTAPGYGSVNALVGYANRSSGSVGVGAATGLAYAQVNELVRYINSRTATVSVTTRGSVAAAEGGLFKFFAGGGVNSFRNTMRSMPANRAEIVPAKTMRVIGDRARGDEAFIPLVNSARSRNILATASARMGYDLVPRQQQQQQTATRTTTVQPGAIVVNAPYSDPSLVARAVVNELTREAVM
jgi:hypothetical protein